MVNSKPTKSKTIIKTSKTISKTRKDPNTRPIPYDRGTMKRAVSAFKTEDVEKVYNHLKNTGGKKSKSLTIKKKKARKTLKKPMFKRKSAKHK